MISHTFKHTRSYILRPLSLLSQPCALLPTYPAHPDTHNTQNTSSPSFYPMPLPIFGTNHRSLSEIKQALSTGYRHLDCASMYGNESMVGKALSHYLTCNPDLTRSDVYITTKLWCQEYTPSEASNSVNLSLERFQLDYIDCLLLHLPYNMKKRVPLSRDSMSLVDVWNSSLLPLVTSGRVRSLGVSNFDASQLEPLLIYPDVRFKPTLNQLECHVRYHQRDTIRWCHERGIHCVAWGPLNRGDTVGIDVNTCLEWVGSRGVGWNASSRRKERLEKNLNNWRGNNNGKEGRDRLEVYGEEVLYST